MHFAGIARDGDTRGCVVYNEAPALGRESVDIGGEDEGVLTKLGPVANVFAHATERKCHAN